MAEKSKLWYLIVICTKLPYYKMDQKKYVVLTDMKEFTYKNSLLTSKQVEHILKAFESIVLQAAKKYKVQVVKSIWDAYLCLSDDYTSSIDFCNTLQSESLKYDKKEKLDIKKIALRSVISYGNITHNSSMNLDDYFGEAINLASRVMSITPAYKIFATKKAVWDHATEVQYLWKFQFHGIIEEVQLYSLTSISDSEMKEVKNIQKSILEECHTIIFRAACVSAILSAQPLPFLESLNIVGIHLYMIIKISQKFWEPVNLRWAKDIFMKIIPQLSIGYFALQWINTGIKFILPGIGGYLFSPISFGMAYAIWNIYIADFCYRSWGKKFESSEILGIFTRQKDRGIDMAKKNKKEVFQTGRKFYGDILSIRKEKWYSKIQKDLTKMLKTQK